MERIYPKQPTAKTPAPKKFSGTLPDELIVADDMAKGKPTEGSEETRKERVKEHKKKMEKENETRQKKRRLVCYSCWAMDGCCQCNMHEVDADHPLMVDGKSHIWKGWGGDGKCNTIPNAICITRNLGGKAPV